MRKAPSSACLGRIITSAELEVVVYKCRSLAIPPQIVWFTSRRFSTRKPYGTQFPTDGLSRYCFRTLKSIMDSSILWPGEAWMTQDLDMESQSGFRVSVLEIRPRITWTSAGDPTVWHPMSLNVFWITEKEKEQKSRYYHYLGEYLSYLCLYTYIY